jgi:hypothetical protein
MISLEEIRKYLPKYLSADAQEDLFAELKTFPENMDQRLTPKPWMEKRTYSRAMA